MLASGMSACDVMQADGSLLSEFQPSGAIGTMVERPDEAGLSRTSVCHPVLAVPGDDGRR